MNQALTGIIGQLIGNFVGDKTPQVNPNYLDENGQPVEGQTPYLQPGLTTRMFHPEVASIENQFNAHPYQEQVQNAVANQIGAKNFRTVQPFLKTPMSEIAPEVGSILTGRNPTSSILYGADADAANEAAGLPTLSATNRVANLTEDTRKANADLNNNLPESLSDASLARSRFDNKLSYSLLNRLPSEEASAIARNNAETLTAPHVADATVSNADAANEASKRSLLNKFGLDSEFNANVHDRMNRATLAAVLSGGDLKQLPTLIDTRNAQIANEARTAAYPAPMGNIHYIGEDGALHPNPNSEGTLQSLSAKINGNPTKVIPVSKGLNMVIEPHPTKQLLNQPLSSQETNAVVPYKTTKSLPSISGVDHPDEVNLPDNQNNRASQVAKIQNDYESKVKQNLAEQNQIKEANELRTRISILKNQLQASKYGTGSIQTKQDYQDAYEELARLIDHQKALK